MQNYTERNKRFIQECERGHVIVNGFDIYQGAVKVYVEGKPRNFQVRGTERLYIWIDKKKRFLDRLTRLENVPCTCYFRDANFEEVTLKVGEKAVFEI